MWVIGTKKFEILNADKKTMHCQLKKVKTNYQWMSLKLKIMKSSKSRNSENILVWLIYPNPGTSIPDVSKTISMF